jgi:hypothetical protein
MRHDTKLNAPKEKISTMTTTKCQENMLVVRSGQDEEGIQEGSAAPF